MAGERAFSPRRWFQFSLTSLLLLTTLVALWLAWELAFIRERQAWLRDNAATVESSASYITFGQVNLVNGQASPTTLPPTPTIPWWRRMLGDEVVPTITEGEHWTAEDRALVARLFPEAVIEPRVALNGITWVVQPPENDTRQQSSDSEDQ